jgi:hypothetical protein
MVRRSGRPANLDLDRLGDLDRLLEDLMEPVGRQARRRTVDAIRKAGRPRAI